MVVGVGTNSSLANLECAHQGRGASALGLVRGSVQAYGVAPTGRLQCFKGSVT